MRKTAKLLLLLLLLFVVVAVAVHHGGSYYHLQVSLDTVFRVMHGPAGVVQIRSSGCPCAVTSFPRDM